MIDYSVTYEPNQFWAYVERATYKSLKDKLGEYEPNKTRAIEWASQILSDLGRAFFADQEGPRPIQPEVRLAKWQNDPEILIEVGAGSGWASGGVNVVFMVRGGTLPRGTLYKWGKIIVYKKSPETKSGWAIFEPPDKANDFVTALRNKIESRLYDLPALANAKGLGVTLAEDVTEALLWAVTESDDYERAVRELSPEPTVRLTANSLDPRNQDSLVFTMTLTDSYDESRPWATQVFFERDSGTQAYKQVSRAKPPLEPNNVAVNIKVDTKGLESALEQYKKGLPGAMARAYQAAAEDMLINSGRPATTESSWVAEDMTKDEIEALKKALERGPGRQAGGRPYKKSPVGLEVKPNTDQDPKPEPQDPYDRVIVPALNMTGLDYADRGRVLVSIKFGLKSKEIEPGQLRELALRFYYLRLELNWAIGLDSGETLRGSVKVATEGVTVEKAPGEGWQYVSPSYDDIMGPSWLCLIVLTGPVGAYFEPVEVAPRPGPKGPTKRRQREPQAPSKSPERTRRKKRPMI